MLGVCERCTAGRFPQARSNGSRLSQACRGRLAQLGMIGDVPVAKTAAVADGGVAPVVERNLDSFCRGRHARLVGMLGLYVGQRELGEDLAQEAMVRLCQHWHRLPTDADAERWLNRVAFNLAKSAIRSRSTRRRIHDRFDHTMVGRPAAPESADVLAVRAAVAGLPELPRRALILRYYADLPVAEVAELMHCPAGTVKTYTHQAIAALRRSGLGVDE